MLNSCLWMTGRHVRTNYILLHGSQVLSTATKKDLQRTFQAYTRNLDTCDVPERGKEGTGKPGKQDLVTSAMYSNSYTI